MTLRNNRAPLLYYIKLCASFQSYGWIQTGVTVRKRSIRVKNRQFFVLCDLQIWRMTLKNNRAPLLSCFKLCASCPADIWNLYRVKRRLHQHGKTRGAPARIPPAGSAVDRFVEIVWCCLHRLGSAEPPQQARCGCPQRLLTKRFFCGTRRNREHWLVSIYRSKAQCHSETVRGPALVKRLNPRKKRSLNPRADPLRAGVNAPLEW